MAQALEHFLDEQAWQVAQIQESLAQAEEGKFASSIEVQTEKGSSLLLTFVNLFDDLLNSLGNPLILLDFRLYPGDGAGDRRKRGQVFF
ncbi:MAG: hypothetical protein KKC92_03410 [Proteobacteria bacterium]|nr:hypothetical protein [Pseudomonadota bacterium]